MSMSYIFKKQYKVRILGNKMCDPGCFMPVLTDMKAEWSFSLLDISPSIQNTLEDSERRVKCLHSKMKEITLRKNLTILFDL